MCIWLLEKNRFRFLRLLLDLYQLHWPIAIQPGNRFCAERDGFLHLQNDVPLSQTGSNAKLNSKDAKNWCLKFQSSQKLTGDH